MFKNQLLIWLISLLFISCSTSLSEYFNKKEETGQRNEELIKSFEGEEDVFKKFKEEVKIEVKEVQAVPNTKITSKKSLKKVKSKTSKIKKVIKKKTKLIPKIIVKKSKYPEDFPEEYKKIDKASQSFWSSFKPRVFEGEESIWTLIMAV